MQDKIIINPDSRFEQIQNRCNENKNISILPQVKNSFTIILKINVPWDTLKANYEKEFNRIKANTKSPFPGSRKGKFYGKPAMDWFNNTVVPSIEAEFAQNSINQYYKME